jgi:hypothetical protein
VTPRSKDPGNNLAPRTSQAILHKLADVGPKAVISRPLFCGFAYIPSKQF